MTITQSIVQWVGEWFANLDRAVATSLVLLLLVWRFWPWRKRYRPLMPCPRCGRATIGRREGVLLRHYRCLTCGGRIPRRSRR